MTEATNGGQTDAGDTPNEILAAVSDAARGKAAALKAKNVKARGKSWPLATIGLAAGIGSAAVAGAVLFARRDRGAK